MQCPVCGAVSRDMSPGDFDGLIVDCKHCGDYAIVGSALNALLTLGFNERVDALEKARSVASPSVRPTTSTDCL